MPAIPMNQIQPVLDRIDAFCRELGSGLGDRMLRGSLLELKVHFLQRNIPGAICTDLDFILIRYEGKRGKDSTPVALIEIKKNGRPLELWQENVYRTLAENAKVPFYLLEATDWGTFQVTENGTGSQVGPLNLEELGAWMRSFIEHTEFVTDDRNRPLAEVY